MKLAILLTATIIPQVQNGNFSVPERVEMYKKTLRYYASVVGKRYPIIFVENSDYDLNAFTSFRELLNIEFVQFKPGNGVAFNNEKGKGYNEYLMIKEALTESRTLQNCNYFLKITGRYPMLNIISIITEIEKRGNEKVFFCDIKDTNIYKILGSSNEGHWGDSRFWVARIDFYKKELADGYKWMDDSHGKYAEEYLYNLSKKYRNDDRFIFRFRHQVRFDGFSGSVASIKDAHGNMNYNSFSSRCKYYVRSILRLVFCKLWF